MTTQLLRGLFCVLCLTIFAACESGDLSIKATEELAKLELTNTHFEAKNIGRIAMTLTGKIPKSISTIEVSLDDGVSWKMVPMPESAIMTQASDCKQVCNFNFAITDLGARWPELQTMHGGDRRTLLVRGKGRFGQTPSTPVTITKLPSGYRALSTWSDADFAKGVRRVAADGTTISSLSFESEKARSSTGTLNVRWKGRSE